MNIYRTHDREIYLSENRYDFPKEIFKVLANRVRELRLADEGVRIGDIGCASGEFLYYLRSQFSRAVLHGYDVVPKLIEKARQKVQGVTLQQGSVLDRSALPKGFLDIAFLIGVHCIFEEFETCLSNVLHWTQPTGHIFVFGPFNPFPVDVWIKYRSVGDPDKEHLEPGWNLFSKQSISNYLDRQLGPNRHTFTPFELPFDLPPHEGDPIRAWTFLDNNLRRFFTNGLSLLLNFEVLEIHPKPTV